MPMVNGHVLKRKLRGYFPEHHVLSAWRMRDGKHFRLTVMSRGNSVSRDLYCDPDEEVFWEDFYSVAGALSNALKAAVAKEVSPWEVGEDGRVYPKGWRPRWATKHAA